MSNGEELGKLLNEAEVINKKMDATFIRNNVKYLDIKNLPQEAKGEWDQLFKQKGKITEQIGKLFR